MYLSTGTIALLARSRWPGRHYQELAKVLGVSPVTAKSYVLGTRRMPAHRMRRLASYLRDDMALTQNFIDQLEGHARQEDRRFKPRTGFFIQRDWYGDGVISDKRWRWGFPPRRAG